MRIANLIVFLRKREEVMRAIASTVRPEDASRYMHNSAMKRDGPSVERSFAECNNGPKNRPTDWKFDLSQGKRRYELPENPSNIWDKHTTHSSRERQ
ncbi:hypothetical protein BURKHO8Y_70142 [Burkholderia sp. 8Y]|nr:hypothetical protein BURKHO8Y_70142 [Burkholderia sp. 8Y]